MTEHQGDSGSLVSPMWQSIYRQKLVDLGVFHKDPEIAGIYSPVYEPAEIARFMSEHYANRENVRKQAECLHLTDYYKHLLMEAFERLRFPSRSQDSPLVLELGAGFGSATFPLLSLLPGATVIASEFSVAMLAVLKEKLEREPRSVQSRCGLLQLNAENLDFEENSCDLVVGAALLHHLFRPEQVMAGCHKILKPGGHALFFEPFESGMSIVNIIYKMFLDNPRSSRLPKHVRDYMAYSSAYWDGMTHFPKDHVFFQGADDKWLFTRRFLEAEAAKVGFTTCVTYGISKSERPFEEMVKSHFKGNAMPEPEAWMLEIVDRFENNFSKSMKLDLFTEGVLVLTK